MRRNNFILIVLILILSISGIVSADGNEEFFWSNMNTDPVKNGPPNYVIIKLEADEDPIRLQRITTFHWNNGSGAEPGMVSIYNGEQEIASWPSTGRSAFDTENVYWDTNVDIILYPGYEYSVRIPAFATWSWNNASESRGMTELYGIRLKNFNDPQPSGDIEQSQCATPDPGIGILLNNKTIDLTNEYGTQPVLLVYNDTVYIPIGIVPEVTGTEVTWDENTRILNFISGIAGETAEGGVNFAMMAKKISFSKDRYAVIKEDGSLWTWGEYPGNGEEGAGWSKDIFHIMDGVEAVYTADDASLAIKTDGTLWAWGRNTNYILGIGQNDPNYKALRPVKIMDNVVDASIGSRTAAAVTADGGLYLWGDNSDGNLTANIWQLGGNIKEFLVPTRVMEGVADVSCNDYNYGAYVMVLKQDGTLWTFGADMYGQLGDGLTDLSQRFWKFEDGGGYGRWPFEWQPRQIMDNVVFINAGDRMGMAIKSDGSLLTWGWNVNDRLGNGGANNTKCLVNGEAPCQTIPMKIADNAVQAVTTYEGGFSAFLKKDGSLWAAGKTYSNVPTRLNIEDVVAITADSINVFALKSDGTIWKIGASWSEPSQVTGISR